MSFKVTEQQPDDGLGCLLWCMVLFFVVPLIIGCCSLAKTAITVGIAENVNVEGKVKGTIYTPQRPLGKIIYPETFKLLIGTEYGNFTCQDSFEGLAEYEKGDDIIIKVALVKKKGYVYANQSKCLNIIRR